MQKAFTLALQSAPVVGVCTWNPFRQPEDVLAGFWKVGSTVQSNSSGQTGHSSAPKKNSVQSCKLRLEVSSYYTLGSVIFATPGESDKLQRQPPGHDADLALKMSRARPTSAPKEKIKSTGLSRHICHHQPQPL